VTLSTGMTVRRYNGRLATVQKIAVEPVDSPEPTFNLSIDLHATYFAGAPGVLVHNGTPLGQPEHSVYVLKRNGRIYYVGRFGPNETRESVLYRHSNTPRVRPPGVSARFGPGDTIEVVHNRTLTYAEARRLEHELCVRNRTYIGRGNNWRGNRDYPMGPRKFSRYYTRNACP